MSWDDGLFALLELNFKLKGKVKTLAIRFFKDEFPSVTGICSLAWLCHRIFILKLPRVKEVALRLQLRRFTLYISLWENINSSLSLTRIYIHYLLCCLHSFVWLNICVCFIDGILVRPFRWNFVEHPGLSFSKRRSVDKDV